MTSHAMAIDRVRESTDMLCPVSISCQRTLIDSIMPNNTYDIRRDNNTLAIKLPKVKVKPNTVHYSSEITSYLRKKMAPTHWTNLIRQSWKCSNCQPNKDDTNVIVIALSKHHLTVDNCAVCHSFDQTRCKVNTWYRSKPTNERDIKRMRRFKR